MTSPTETSTHYQRPGWFTRNVGNRLMKLLMRFGVSVAGSQVLEHKGRRTGEIHRIPVNPLTLDGEQYLVAARGETEWVRNVRASGDLSLALGRIRVQHQAVEIPEAERTPILRAYLQRWKFEVGMFFEGVGPDSSDDEFATIAGRHPVFMLR